MTNPSPVSDRIIAYIRTYVPVLVGSGIAYLIGHFTIVASYLALANKALGTDVTGLIATAATAAVIALYYYLARLVGKKFPSVEKWLLGSAATPTYVLPATAVTFADAAPDVAADPEPITEAVESASVIGDVKPPTPPTVGI